MLRNLGIPLNHENQKEFFPYCISLQIIFCRYFFEIYFNKQKYRELILSQ